MNKVYEDLMTLPGVSSREDKVRAYMRNYMSKYPQYQIQTDKLGSIFAVKKSSKSDLVVMVAAHMDEIGFLVSAICENGLIKLQPIGGILGEVFVSQVLFVYTESGKIIKGVVGSIPPHLKKSQSTDTNDLRLDCGATSKQEAKEWGIEVGNMVLFANQFSYTPNKKRFISKAIDNRFGCGLALEAIKNFANIELPYTLVIGATVQEEVGLRGAETSVGLFKPQVFIALDASPIVDLVDSEAIGKIGDGFLLRIYDPRNIMPQGLAKYFINLATKHKIKYQPFVSKGGTDAAKALDMHEGILATTIGLPARYIHSTAALAQVSDVMAAKKMLFAVLNDLDQNKINKIKEVNR